MSNVASIIERTESGWLAAYGEKRKLFKDIVSAGKWVEECKDGGIQPYEDATDEFLRRFCEAVDSRKISRTHIAHMSGLTPAQISKYTYTRLPNVGRFMNICKAARMTEKDVMYCLSAFWGG